MSKLAEKGVLSVGDCALFCFASKLKKKKNFSSFYVSGKYSAFSHVLDHSVFVGWGRGWWLSAKGYDRRSLKGVGVGRDPSLLRPREDRQESYENISPQNGEKRQWTKIYIFRRQELLLLTSTATTFTRYYWGCSIFWHLLLDSKISSPAKSLSFFSCKYLLSLEIRVGTST